jgi:hypothetical protein
VTPVEQLFWAEVRSPQSTRRSLAVCYALLIVLAAARHREGKTNGADFWGPVNRAVSARLRLTSVGQLTRFRKTALDINDAAWAVRDAA